MSGQTNHFVLHQGCPNLSVGPTLAFLAKQATWDPRSWTVSLQHQLGTPKDGFCFQWLEMSQSEEVDSCYPVGSLLDGWKAQGCPPWVVPPHSCWGAKEDLWGCEGPATVFLLLHPGSLCHGWTNQPLCTAPGVAQPLLGSPRNPNLRKLVLVFYQ